MIRQCAWCKRVFGEVAPLEDKRVTHTICDKCLAQVKSELKKAG